MQPDWKGVCADTIAQARTAAGKDYVVLMADMFGKGYGDKPEDAAGAAGRHDRRAPGPRLHPCLRRRAYDALMAEANKLGVVDAGKKAAIGYCAGGGFVLEQARAGADFKAVVVLHVTNPNPVAPRHALQHQGKGAGDPRLGRSGDAEADDGCVRGGAAKAKVDWQVMMFGGAVHSFCDPTVNAGPTRYDEKLCRQSYRLMRDFFAETL
jgi:dienelactone hydrolase